MHGTVIVITGPPGAGKSTTARSVAATYRRAVHLHTDDFWHSIVSGGIAPFLSEADPQNHTVLDVIARAAFAYANGGYVVVVDGIVGPWMLEHLLEVGAEHPGVPLHYVVLRPDEATTLHRAQSRTSPDALVADEPIRSLWNQFADLGELEEHVITTTTHGPDDTARAVVEAVAGGRLLLRD